MANSSLFAPSAFVSCDETLFRFSNIPIVANVSLHVNYFHSVKLELLVTLLTYMLYDKCNLTVKRSNNKMKHVLTR